MEVWPQIHVKNRTSGEKKKYRADQERILIGRDPASFILLEERSVSRRHAEIAREGAQYYLRDLKSNNGTRLNENPLDAYEKILLKPGDQIQIEGFDIVFQIPTGPEAEDPYESTDSDILEIKMVKKLLRAMDRESSPTFEIAEGPHAGERFVFEGKKQEITIGRDPASEFQIDTEVISRKHARVVKNLDQVTLIDLGSKNGTFVNRDRLPPKSERALRDGDIVHLGTLRLSFRNPQELSLEIFPSRPPAVGRETKPAAPEDEKVPEEREALKKEEKIAPAGGVRATRAREAKLREAAEGVDSSEAPAPPSATMPARRFGLSPGEIAMIFVGLAVLVGSLWAILKILN